MTTTTKFDVEAARAELVETFDAIKAQDAREHDLTVQLRINNRERDRNFRRVAAIYREAGQAGLSPDEWWTLGGDLILRREVNRALAVASLDR